jgi:5-(carboxyamino)imidazole ribonucleotide synthase
MINLLGDLWQAGEPNWSQALALPDVKLHLYGKREPRPGRKLGHVTAFGETLSMAADHARDARLAIVDEPALAHFAI